MKISWATDLHLDMVNDKAYHSFIEKIKAEQPTVLLLAGDIADAASLETSLSKLSRDISIPIYFVLGNHDFYGNSIENVRFLVDQAVKELPNMHYLSHESVIPLNEKTALIGHDGWADGKAGNFMDSDVLLRDYFEISNFLGLSKGSLLNRLNKLGEEAARKISVDLNQALQNFEEVILVTHAPPYVESSLYEGKPSLPDWSPHFVSKSVGDALLDMMRLHPQKKLTVLCGHTHHAAHVPILPNLTVIVGEAEYGLPTPQPNFLIS